jgi:hydrogenase nickel incorporation protein HypB
MCKDCGCTIAPHAHPHEHSHGHSHDQHPNPQLNDPKTIEVITKILDVNDTQARHNREHFESHGIFAVNLMSSPGSGKTTLLEATIEEGSLKIGVIEGDLETNQDADRIIAKGAVAHQITTGQACHFEFDVQKAISETRKLNPKVDVIEIDSKSGKGIDKWVNYLKTKKSCR